MRRCFVFFALGTIWFDLNHLLALFRLSCSLSWMLSMEWSEVQNEKEGKNPPVSVRVFSIPRTWLSRSLEQAKFAVIWVSPRFGHPHSQNLTDMGIPFSYYPSDLSFWVYAVRVSGDTHITNIGFWELGCPKRGDAHITRTKTIPGGIALVFTHKNGDFGAISVLNGEKRRRAYPKQVRRRKPNIGWVFSCYTAQPFRVGS